MIKQDTERMSLLEIYQQDMEVLSTEDTIAGYGDNVISDIIAEYADNVYLSCNRAGSRGNVYQSDIIAESDKLSPLSITLQNMDPLSDIIAGYGYNAYLRYHTRIWR